MEVPQTSNLPTQATGETAYASCIESRTINIDVTSTDKASSFEHKKAVLKNEESTELSFYIRKKLLKQFTHAKSAKIIQPRDRRKKTKTEFGISEQVITGPVKVGVTNTGLQISALEIADNFLFVASSRSEGVMMYEPYSHRGTVIVHSLGGKKTPMTFNKPLTLLDHDWGGIVDMVAFCQNDVQRYTGCGSGEDETMACTKTAEVDDVVLEESSDEASNKATGEEDAVVSGKSGVDGVDDSKSDTEVMSGTGAENSINLEGSIVLVCLCTDGQARILQFDTRDTKFHLLLSLGDDIQLPNGDQLTSMCRDDDCVRFGGVEGLLYEIYMPDILEHIVNESLEDYQLPFSRAAYNPITAIASCMKYEGPFERPVFYSTHDGFVAGLKPSTPLLNTTGHYPVHLACSYITVLCDGVPTQAFILVSGAHSSAMIVTPFWFERSSYFRASESMLSPSFVPLNNDSGVFLSTYSLPDGSFVASPVLMAYKTRVRLRQIVPIICESESILSQTESFDRRKTKSSTSIEVGCGKGLATTIHLGVPVVHDAGLWAGLATGYKHVHCKSIGHKDVLFTGTRSGLLYGISML